MILSILIDTQGAVTFPNQGLTNNNIIVTNPNNVDPYRTGDFEFATNNSGIALIAISGIADITLIIGGQSYQAQVQIKFSHSLFIGEPFININDQTLTGIATWNGTLLVSRT